MRNELKIAAVIVLYNPQNEFLKKITFLSNQLDLVVVIDNSEKKNPGIKSTMYGNNIRYVDNGKNIGIAAALNQGAEIAKETEVDFLLLLDQDTDIDSFCLEAYNRFLVETSSDKIGALTPTIKYSSDFREDMTLIPKEIKYAITSGTLLNLRAFNEVGQFEDKLFIDYVDFEYCLRLRKKDYKLIHIPAAKINQHLGDLESKKILFKKIYVTHHSPVR